MNEINDAGARLKIIVGRLRAILDQPAQTPESRVLLSAAVVELGRLSEEMQSPREPGQSKVTLRGEEAGTYNRSLIEASLDPLVTIDADGKITDVNAATEKVTGRTRHELVGTDFSDYFTEPERAQAGYQTTFRQGSVQDYALEIRHKGGHETPVLYNATIYRNDAGEVQGVFAAARDITEQKRAEASRAQLAAIVESSHDAIHAKDLNGIVLSWNQGAVKIYGYSVEEMIGRSIAVLVPPDRPNQVPLILDQIKEGRSVQHYETQHLTKDGRLIDVSLTTSPIRDGSGRVVGASTIARDITDRRRAEESLRLAGAYNRSLIEASLDPLVTIDAIGKVKDVNAATEKITGRNRQELIGTDFSAYFTEPEKASAGYHRVFREGSVQDYALEIRHRAGHQTPVLYNASVYRDAAGQVIGVFAAARDITERRRVEEELRRLNEELERRVAARTADLAASNKELEAFAYSVSHDLRAPLRAMDGFSQALLEDYADKLDGEGKNYLQRVRLASQRMGQLIEGILVLSRTSRSEMRIGAVDLSVLADGIARELQRSHPGRQVEFAIAPRLVVNGDMNLLRIMLENLLGNAWKFTGKHPCAHIEVGKMLHQGKTAYFVRDDGAGFDMAYVGKLFGAFQRLHTNREFEGTGVGLATVQRIVHRHGGQVWAEGETERGAAFFFTIPTNPGEP